MPQLLTPVTRSQFVYQINQFLLDPPSPLPWWLSTGGSGWPMPWYTDNPWVLFQVGRWGYNVYVQPVIDETIEEILDYFKGWIHGLSGECADADELADKFEEWCENNNHTPWVE